MLGFTRISGTARRSVHALIAEPVREGGAGLPHDHSSTPQVSWWPRDVVGSLPGGAFRPPPHELYARGTRCGPLTARPPPKHLPTPSDNPPCRRGRGARERRVSCGVGGSTPLGWRPAGVQRDTLKGVDQGCTCPLVRVGAGGEWWCWRERAHPPAGPPPAGLCVTGCCSALPPQVVVDTAVDSLLPAARPAPTVTLARQTRAPSTLSSSGGVVATGG